MKLSDYIENLRSMSDENFDDEDMIIIINQAVHEINSYGIEGLRFSTLNQVCDLNELDKHNVMCSFKQEEKHVNVLVTPLVISKINLLLEDLELGYFHKSEFENAIKRYKASFSLIDMTGNTTFILSEDIKDFECICDNPHAFDHYHDIKTAGVSNDRHYIKSVAKGTNKRHNVANNGIDAIVHRNGGNPWHI